MGKIKKLLKKYTVEEIVKVINFEIKEKYGQHYMQNFSTFLNNFPDPSLLFDNNTQQTNVEDNEKKVVINGQIYR